jgi:hypothetical protein
MPDPEVLALAADEGQIRISIIFDDGEAFLAVH